MADGRLDEFCSRRSIQLRERIFGTASTVEVWLLLEYGGLWTPDLLHDSNLPDEVKGALQATLRAVSGSRLLFIKNDLRGKAGLSFFVAITREREQALYRFEIDDYRDLLQLDVVGLPSGRSGDRLRLLQEPLYLVCVDGKHDKCCAKFGLPVHREMVRAAGDAVWQASHLGGDRFAANVVCLPGGVYYGHVEPSEAERIVGDTAAGRIYLDRFRGRCFYGFSTQAADYFARAASGLDQADGLLVSEVARSGDGVRVRLRESGAPREHVVELVRDGAVPRILLTCSADVEHPISRYVLRAYRVEEMFGA